MTEKKLDVLLSPERLQEIDQWIAKFPADKKQSAVLQALRIVQDEHGWLSEELMEAVADYLSMPKIAVFEVATFYNMYHLSPPGKHTIHVCHSIACMLNGSDDVIHYMEEKLGIKMGETTADKKFTLKHAECLGACVNAPVCRIDREYHEKLNPVKIDNLLAEMKD